MRSFIFLILLGFLFSGCETPAGLSSSEYRRIGPPGKGHLTRRRKKRKTFDEKFREDVLDNGLGPAVNRVVTVRPIGNCDNSGPTPRKRDPSSIDPKLDVGKFDPPSGGGKKLNLWATNYYTEAKNNGGSIPLKDKKEKTFVIEGESISLSEKEWCHAAMEGSVSVVLRSGKKVTFNYAGVGSMQANCAKYFSGKFASTGKVKFKISASLYGEGVGIPLSKRKNKSINQGSYSLVPYRTIGVDKRKIPYGSVIYIASAKGTKVDMPDGSTFVHDGYFFAGDTGGAIKGNHIDVFTGDKNTKSQPFNFVKSNSSGTFGAEIVTDKAVIEKMTSMHTKRY